MGDIVVAIFGTYNLSNVYFNQCKYLCKYLTTSNLVDSADKMLPKKNISIYEVSVPPANSIAWNPSFQEFPPHISSSQ